MRGTPVGYGAIRPVQGRNGQFYWGSILFYRFMDDDFCKFNQVQQGIYVILPGDGIGKMGDRTCPYGIQSVQSLFLASFLPWWVISAARRVILSVGPENGCLEAFNQVPLFQ